MYLNRSRVHGHQCNALINRWIAEFGPGPDVGVSLAVDYWLTLQETDKIPKYLADIAIKRIIDGGGSQYAL